MNQGQNFDNWTYFAPGCSVESLERWKRGATASVHKACCKAVERISNEAFPVEHVSAVEPDFAAEYEATKVLLKNTRKQLLAGTPISLGLTAPCWKESDHALGVPLHVAVSDFCFKRIKASALLFEYEIQASYKDTQLPVGRVLVAGNRYSLIFDARPFLWTGQDLTVGRKHIRLVLPKGNIQRHIMELIAFHVEFDAVAS